MNFCCLTHTTKMKCLGLLGEFHLFDWIYIIFLFFLQGNCLRFFCLTFQYIFPISVSDAHKKSSPYHLKFCLFPLKLSPTKCAHRLLKCTLKRNSSTRMIDEYSHLKTDSIAHISLIFMKFVKVCDSVPRLRWSQENGLSMIENITNVIRKKMTVSRWPWCTRNRIFNLKTNLQQLVFFPFKQVFSKPWIRQFTWVICKHITQLFQLSLSPVYHILA